MPEKKESFEKLVEQARNDPKFFHALVFDPERTIATLEYLDRREKAMLVALRPEDVISGLLGLVTSAGGAVAVCGHSCEDSCDDTCGAGSCLGTCLSSSCDHTCGARSCDVTVEIIGRDFGYLARTGRARFLPRRRY
jgi:hypothetical protein